MWEVRHILTGRDGGVLLVTVPERVSHESAEGLVECVRRHLPARDDAGLVLDMGEVVLISSIGVAALLQVRELCVDRTAPVCLARLPAAQMAFMRMLKLDRKFEYAPTVDDAVACVEGARG